MLLTRPFVSNLALYLLDVKDTNSYTVKNDQPVKKSITSGSGQHKEDAWHSIENFSYVVSTVNCILLPLFAYVLC